MKLISAFLLFLFFSFATAKTFAQNYFFTDATESGFKLPGHKRQIVPERYRTVSLDTIQLTQFLATLPLEQLLINRNIAPVLSLPMPDGRVARFRVWESPIAEAGLIQKFPNLKTYTGQGIDDPTATIKIDWTDFGFHAMVYSDITGYYLIDPYDHLTKTNYITYFKKDFHKQDKMKELDPIRYPKVKGITPDNVQAGVCVGTTLRTYRLAVACTHEYAIAATGLATPTVAQALAKIVTSVNRVNGVYEKEVSVRLVLVANNSNVVFPTAAGDPFTGNNSAGTLINESQTNIDAQIGSANYDIGHTFSTGGGGLAGLGVVCRAGQKARGITGSPSPVGDAYDIDYVAHEMGHQFDGEHTFNSASGFCGGNGSSSANAEPGSGSTIMAYAGICSPENLQNNSDAYFTAISFDQISDYTNSGSGNTCPTSTATGNSAPVVNAGADYKVPLSTPFILTGSATDANGDALTYCWEQINVGGPFGTWNAPSGNAPIFRSFAPVSTGTRYFPKLSNVIAGTTTIGEILPTYARVMNFRLTARDNRAAGGGVCRDEMTVTSIAGTGPFLVTYPTATAISWTVGDFKTITWDPAGTAGATINCANVTIQLSTDGGNTYPVTLVASTPNDGSHEIAVPNNVSSTARIRVMAVGNIFYDISNNNFAIVAAPAPSFNFNSPAPVAVCSAASGSATLLTASVNSFATNINLSASLNPAGTTVSFSSNPVAPGGSTVVTLNNTNTLAAGSYTIRITGTAGAITQTRDITFVVGGGAAAPASLTLPANDAIGVGVLPSFNWSTVSGATSYTIEISTVANFSTIAQTISGVTALPYTITTALTENTIYYWRVKSTNGCGTGAASVTPNRFKTGLNSCRISVDIPKTISATGAPTVTSTVVVPASLGAVITDLNVVGLDITHSYISDLTVRLTSPSGTTVDLITNICADEDNINVNLDDQAATATFPCPPLAGTIVQPASALSAFNGQNSTGTWTLTVVDGYDQDGGNINGWGLSINTNTNTCTFSSTPLATTYTFTGNGNWNVASNWSSNTIPPNPLPANASIVINHIVGGNCILNISQTISAGAGITVLTGKNLLVQGNLTIQ